jgi:hypothetical protein
MPDRAEIWNQFAASATAAIIQRYGSPVRVDEDGGHIAQVAEVSARYADELTKQYEARFRQSRLTSPKQKGRRP